MVKLTKRKAFNFLRSYFDVLNEIPEDKDKLAFLLSIINKQFLDEDPEDLEFISKLCYESQRHSIESSVKGWKRVHKTDMQGNPPTDPTTNPTTDPKEEEEKEEEEEKVKEKEKEIRFSFRKSLCQLGLENNLVDDFLKNRKLKRLANTETAFKNLVIEFNKNKMPITELMTKIVSNGWGSFKNSWIEKEKSSAKKEKVISLADKMKQDYNIN